MLSERVFKRRTTSNSSYLLRLAALQNVRQKQNDHGKYLHPPLRAREHYSLFQHRHATILHWDIRWRVKFKVHKQEMVLRMRNSHSATLCYPLTWQPTCVLVMVWLLHLNVHVAFCLLLYSVYPYWANQINELWITFVTRQSSRQVSWVSGIYPWNCVHVWHGFSAGQLLG